MRPPSSVLRPAYLALPLGEIEARAVAAVRALGDCHCCPRRCGVDRLADRWSACKTGRHAVISSWFPHLGEEDCLRGWHGSGTIFFAHCNLRCVFCQNFDISQNVRPGGAARGVGAPQLAEIMLALQDQGCHNVNLVTPEHVVPQVLEALAIAVPKGLRLPIVYNTSAYDSLESLGWLDGIVDVYMPDFKCWTPESSRRFLKAADYPEVARAALQEMQRQVGRLVIDETGLARRGILLRHLVMPSGIEETRAILEWVAETLGTDTYVNLMDQYRPAGRVGPTRYAELNRRTTAAEYSAAVQLAVRLGLRLDKRHMRLPWPH
jgi:putative pyruvate formate lyase activating enzyme